MFDSENEAQVTQLRVADGVESRLRHWRCPACRWLILALERRDAGGAEPHLLVAETIIYPLTGGRNPAPGEVRMYDPDVAEDYDEACAVLDRSPKSAAALGRRCIQRLIHTQLAITRPTLYAEIEAAKASSSLPTKVLRQLEAVRHIGNNAAHPNTDAAGLILPVTRDEAIWTLDVVALMFDELFVQPLNEHKRASALAEKTGKAVDLPDLPTKVAAVGDEEDESVPDPLAESAD